MKGMINNMTTQLPHPQNVFKYFYEIAKIPHGSGNTKAISDYCVNIAKEARLWYHQDEFNNVIIKKPASAGYENHAPIIIQGHLDMVCEKDADINFNFEKDSLILKTEGDLLTAEGTTLGADDGIAVSMALAILTSDDILSPALEVIFTSDEETGMDGAIGLDMSQIDGRMLLNIDSECEGIFTVSCAGGVSAECNIPINTAQITSNVMEITIKGLTGGHSGVEIDKKRANSNILMGSLLSELSEISSVRFVSINGGHKLNAIAAHTTLTVAYSENKDKIISTINNFENKVKEKYSNTDPDMTISYKEVENQQIYAADKKSTLNTAHLLSSLPDGIYSMSTDIEGLVKTSSNFGILKTEKDFIYILISIRSSEEKEKTLLYNKISAIVASHNGSSKSGGDYPAWEYKKESRLRDIMCRVYENQYGKPPKTEAIHAGLECGIFCGKLPELDCVSFGPDMFDIHTPKERLSISSTQRVWEFVKEVLKNL